jgi:type IV pilus assembly protein PilB
VNLLIHQAIIDRASDVHIEPADTTVHVRYRIDGVLHPQADTSMKVLNAVVSRIKIMANLDIAEKRIPQDGRIGIKIQGRQVDLRVSTLPTVYGEKIVLRILDNESTPLNIQDIGLTPANQKIYLRNAKKPHGLILATGPTGSGKTTTLYSTINSVRSPQVNIITVEDPVEFRLPGLNQIQIHPKAGLTFSTALRSILRSDPDIVLVGEIRDAETAKIAVEASLTGHLVLTTLHTNDAASAITRLVEMGIEPYLVAQAITLVVAQRLVRQLCSSCAEEYQPEIEDLTAIEFPMPEDGTIPTIKKAVGCEKCSHTGYRGRLALHELLEVDENLEKLIIDGKYNSDIRRYAQEHAGMKTVREDGWYKVLSGLTTIDEVLRVSV